MAKFASAILAATAGAAAAFAPVPTARTTTGLAEFANGMVGGEGPEPMPFRWGGDKSSKDFDPVGFAERSPEWLNWFREAELKHGRQAMLATVGLVVPEFVRVPGEQFSFEAIPNVLDAHDALLDTSMKQILLWISLAEVMTLAALSNMNEFDRAPGDFGFDPLGLFPNDPAKQDEMRLKELKNGRLAMVAIGGMIHGAIVTGHGFPYL
mmetsp:Transcript_1234/g.2677  ORF Transcript_1234/g.2677 Transcript_1234/m.2677 type:complete len:209 (-) Transcript_1234:321-947(-)|eukprot:CAMPEP_0172546550 /NCGR_PEP_ID=MMETSP1067-20121228/16294_1 /TAXON_ID=265564 ORGANISM="Thalassiosira punctigera, Strain Tpunct2005C2" /NCGR_SAMPLE_ID=MMETSP1067 /ASSEMBLY_ACC=CAM_ASM_000444 /LENGTH=208 /DNA_ID=CAMNT_0013333505 /DNA_START=267 /DNA_END=893 /DNA_ORIENTATION=+